MALLRKHKVSYRRSKRQLRPGLILLSCLILLGGCGLLVDVVSQQLQFRLRNYAYHLNQTIIALETASPNPNDSIQRAKRHLDAAQASIAPLKPLVRFLHTTADDLDLPVGQNLFSWWVFVDEAAQATDASLAALRLGAAAVQTDDVSGLLAALPAMKPHLQRAGDHFSQAQAIRPVLDAARLPGEYSAQAERALARWDQLAPALAERFSQVELLIDTLPQALGRQQPVTYLIILQSSDNLKATGGFLTSAGTVRFEQGKITALDIRDVTEAEFSATWSRQEGYQSQRIVPPDPIRRYMGLGHWVLRDGNWWADFPTTARQAAQFWRLSGGAPVDGVISITDHGVMALLEALGPISTPTGETLDAQNMKIVTSAFVHGGPKSEINNQTYFFQHVAGRMAARLEQLPPDRWLTLAQQLESAAERRDIMVTSFDPELAPAFHKLGLDGAVRGQQDDYFYLVEDNLADSKLSAFVNQTLVYDVYLEPDGSARLATLTIDKSNDYTLGTTLVGFPEGGYNTGGRWDPQTQQWDKWEGYYGGYLRLFPPAGSRYQRAIGFDDRVDLTAESNRTVFGGYVGLWAGGRRQLQYQWLPGYQPPVSGQYRLDVQRQPGALAHPLTIRVHLPDGYQATAVSPTPTTTGPNRVIWRATLDRDLEFSLRLVP